MLRSGFIAVVLAASLGLPQAAAQTTAKDVAKKTGEAWDTVKAYTVDKKKEAQDYGRKLVRDTDRQIDALEAKAAKATGEAKAAYEREIRDLKASRAQAAKKLDEMGKASGAAWNDAKNGFADAYKDLRRAVSKAASRF